MIRMTVKISGRILSDPNSYHPTPSQRCKDRGHPGPVHAQHGPCVVAAARAHSGSRRSRLGLTHSPSHMERL